MFNNDNREFLFGLFVATIAFLVYANSLGNGFTLDDDSVILNNPVLRGNFFSLFSSIDTTGETQLLPFYRPVTYLTYMIEWHLHGFNPFFVRLANVLLHTANSFLVFRLARSLNKDNVYMALLAGILFAVHPQQSEGVNFNAGGRNTMLACFFSISTYLFHAKSILRENKQWALAGALFFLLGIFSKETAVMILPLIFALEFRMLRTNAPNSRLQAFMRLAPYFAALAVYIVMRWLTLSKLGIQTSIIPGVGTKLLESMYITTTLGTRLLDDLYIIPRYFLTAIWPLHLSSRYVMPEDMNLLVLPLLGGWLCILASIGWICTRGRSTTSLFGLAWIVLFWLPVSGIVFVPGAPLADRFFYIPEIGLWIIIADQFCRHMPIEKPIFRRVAGVTVALLLLVLAALTVVRNQEWRSNYSLYKGLVEHYPENVHAHAGLGKVFYGKEKEHDTAKAEREFEKVIAIDPNFPMIYTYLGNIKLNRDDLAGALYCYSKAIEVYPYDKEARLNRGITLEKLGRPKEAITDYLFFMTTPGSSDNLPGGREHAEKRLRELSQ
ncbi:MAG: glycosyltransferase family 39 protein [Desulfuromonadaceae bacterium]|nr:glycosyltransferase family 39 protein [Desulfuromonadaceae bacterium]